MASFAPRPIPSPLHLRLAVVGAGAAGLVAARELRREGHGVVVFERGAFVGGTWVYTPAVESHSLGIDPARNIVHSSLYKSLRTNLPRESMGFLDYPFVPRGSGGDARRFPSHEEVLRYLENFAEEFGLIESIRFRTEVERVEREVDGKRWIVKSREVGGGGEKKREVYDGVVVCNGHYTEPRIAEISGIDAWPGNQMHSHNYRVPEPFVNQAVIVIGSSASAVDISRDVARLAKEVHIASRSVTGRVPAKVPSYENMWFHSTIERADRDGSVVFHDGSLVYADVIIHCTGYKYYFPFLETNGVLTVDDNRVSPLYKHVFPPQLAPSLSFIGLPWKVIPFPLVELQCKWLAGILSGRIELPLEEEMLKDVKADYQRLEMKGWPKRYAHNFSDFQFEYDDWLAEQCGLPPVEDWRKEMYVVASKNRVARPEVYRDEWDDDHLVEQSYKYFENLVQLS
ncbi:Flavin-containing monooxygenase [Rhynchospora pubera]|uniref:Flavin-containing monooxygenase n=1 Tax=Rhynchospora pubera TaxID=906938 RepID=A0AAV8CHD3_9POAL|nr:Flavin-containing monooxygenase [Rhynchospora pubera]